MPSRTKGPRDPEPTTDPDPLTLVVRLTPQAYARLSRLLGTGLYGWTLDEAAGRLIDRGLEGVGDGR